MMESTTRAAAPSAAHPTNGRSAAPAAGEESEAYRTLLQLAHGKTATIPAAYLVRHVLRVTGDAPWQVQRAALESVLRRVGLMKRDGLTATARGAKERPPGLYRTRGARVGERPYTTMVFALEPLHASCDCPDYRRNALGLCKHVLAALAALGAGKRPAATRGDGVSAIAAPPLCWNPVKPLSGDGDWLERVYWHPRAGQRPGGRLAELFPQGAGGRIARELLQELGARRRVVDALWGYVHRRGVKGLRAEPALSPLLAAEREHLERLERGRELRRLGAAAARTVKTKLYPYQRDGLQAFLERGRLLLADDMGLGKTAQAIAAAHVLWRLSEVRRGLLVVPASLKAQWQREWRLFSDAPVQIVDGTPEERRATYERCKRGFLIANYEQVVRDLELMQAWQPELVVLDEAQRIKNWATRTAAQVKRLAPRFRLVLTGTPLENRLEELGSILEWVDPDALAPAWRIDALHGVRQDGRRELVGVRNLDTLRRRMSHCMVRRLRKDVLGQLPSRTDTRVPVELTEAQRAEHEALAPAIARLVATAKRRPLTQAEFLRLMSLLTAQRMICNGLALADFAEVWPALTGVPRPSDTLLASLSSPKLLELREVVSRIAVEQGRKVVVFSQWRRMLQLAHWATSDLLAAAGARAAFFSGQESQRRRADNIVAFHDDPDMRVLFATDAGGVGLNLQRASSCVVNLELPWNPAVLEQRIGRVHRNGQREPVEVYNLVCADGIEARIADVVSGKQALFKGLFDGASDEVRFDGASSFLARVEALMPDAAPAGGAKAPTKAEAEAALEAQAEAALEAEAEADAEIDAQLDTPPAVELGDHDEDPATPIAASSPSSPSAEPAPAPALAPPAAPAPPATATATATPTPTPSAAAALPTDTTQLAGLLSQLRVATSPRGELTITAPPEAAVAVGRLFQELGRRLMSSAEG